MSINTSEWPSNEVTHKDKLIVPVIKSIVTAYWHYEPTKVMTNEELWKIYQWLHNTNSSSYISAENIIQKSERVWIFERRRSEKENALELARKAVLNLWDKFGEEKLDWIDGIYVWSLSAPSFFPTIAPQLAQALGMTKIEAFDIMNACPSFLNGVMAADRSIRCWDLKKVLVVWTDVMSWMIKDFNYKTWILFWDWAWVILLEPSTIDYNWWVQWSKSTNEIQSEDCLLFRSQFFEKEFDVSTEIFHLDWPSVYEKGVWATTKMITDYCNKKWKTITDYNRIIPHQANAKMLKEISTNLGIDDIMIKNLATNGNTAAASIPLALSQNAHRFKKWDKILMVSFGAWFSLALVDLVWSL